MGDLKADLESAGFELVETHISWVFLGAKDVYKVKRPVDFGFLDFTTVEARRKACRAEVRLNRRLAPDVYLGVVPITSSESGKHAIEGPGRTVDWAVHMRRLPVDSRADVMLGNEALGRDQIDALAEHVAVFHDGARCDEETAKHGEVGMIRRNVRENFAQTRDCLSEYLTQAQADEIEAWQLRTLDDEARFSARIEAGRVRDGHGDLRLEHVYFEDASISVIDCIEFNERFRYGDVCSDIAFLSMDLAWHGRVDLAERFLAQYARRSHDYDLYTVVDFYESYRAFVRGKIASFLAVDMQASAATRERARQEARRYFMLSLAYERPPLVPPRLVAVGGLIASGKSRWARAVGDLLEAPVVSSDRTRKHLMGLEPEQSMASPAWSGAYAPQATERVYRELASAADTVLRSGRAVVIDASFRTIAMREAIRELARRRNVPFTLIECTAPRGVLLERLAARDEKGTHESDARADLLGDFESRFEPMHELPESEHLVLDTSSDSAVNRQRIGAILKS